MHTCNKCDKSFSRRDALVRHEKSCGAGDSLAHLVMCMLCLSTFTRWDALVRHHKKCHPTERLPSKRQRSPSPAPGMHASNNQPGPSGMPKRQKVDAAALKRCHTCSIMVQASAWAAHLRSMVHKEKTAAAVGEGVFLINHAFNKRISTYRIPVPEIGITITDFMLFVKRKLYTLLAKKLSEFGNVKFYLELFGQFTNRVSGEEATKSFGTKAQTLTTLEEYDELWETLAERITTRYQDFQEKDSGWTLKNWLFLEANVSKFNPMRASSYLELPKTIRDKHAVLNIQNNDDFCFKWAVLAALHPVDRREHPHRVQHYMPYAEELNFTGMRFPLPISDISKFESLNNISVNVYGLERKFQDKRVWYETVGPIHFTASRKERHINLLIISDDFGNNHYCLIKDMSRLVRSQISLRNCRKYLCDGCLVFFTSEARLNEHQQHDCNHVSVKLRTTELRKDKLGDLSPENELKFEDFGKKLRVPFVIYADSESALEPKEHEAPVTDGSYTIATHQHVPYSFAYYIKCTYNDSLSKFVSYRGDNAAKTFVSRLENDVKDLYTNHLRPILPMQPLSAGEERQFQEASTCHICERVISPDQTRVRDHCHLTGLFRGAAHEACNLNFKIPNFIPVIFHNLSGYDSHLFIKSLADEGSQVDVIAQNKERYISFTKSIMVGEYENREGKRQNLFLRLRFIDSFRFMAKSLDKLASNLEPKQFREVRKHFTEESKFNLIRQKGVFPYSYVTHSAKLDDPQLPSRASFFDELRQEECGQDEYDRALSVWKEFECQTLGEYSDIYLKSDVLILADVFENFRDVCMKIYGLDPCQYFTAPGLSWSAALKYTGVKLELLSDIDMHHFIKRGIRGGVSQCSVRRAKANNRYMNDMYDHTKPTSFISYLDATNLYGWAMCQALPTGDFKWVEDAQRDNFDVFQIDDGAETGYILEVDLEYPEHLHDLHNDLPFCPENFIPPSSKAKVSKLIPNLNKKQNYIIHYRNLKQCLAAGLILTKVHRVLAFKQSPWLKKYIDLNTEMRNKAKNDFEKDFYKLMNNAMFGKTMENVDKRVDIKLVTHWENIGRKVGAEALIAKPHFKSHLRFTDNFCAIQMRKMQVVYDKPIYVGFSILDISKTCIYDFYYNFIKSKYGDRASLLYTDTDSLVLYVETEDFYKDIKENLGVFDTSNYKPGNIYDIPVNPSVLGRMKDEFKGKIVHEFVGTGAKAYMVDVEGEYTKKAKGVQQCVVKKHLTAEDYINVVESEGDTLVDADGDVLVADGGISVSMRVFRTHLHDVYTNLVKKVALSYFDDKRYLLHGSYKTLAWGHRDI